MQFPYYFQIRGGFSKHRLSLKKSKITMQPIVESIGKRFLSGSFENVQGEPSCSMRDGAR